MMSRTDSQTLAAPPPGNKKLLGNGHLNFEVFLTLWLGGTTPSNYEKNEPKSNCNEGRESGSSHAYRNSKSHHHRVCTSRPCRRHPQVAARGAIASQARAFAGARLK
jgi:hypothetical protein